MNIIYRWHYQLKQHFIQWAVTCSPRKMYSLMKNKKSFWFFFFTYEIDSRGGGEDKPMKFLIAHRKLSQTNLAQVICLSMFSLWGQWPLLIFSRHTLSFPAFWYFHLLLYCTVNANYLAHCSMLSWQDWSAVVVLVGVLWGSLVIPE